VQPGDLSPDRLWRWDGARWVPATPTHETAAAAPRRLSWFAISGGILAIVGAISIIPACALDYVHYTDNTEPSSVSVFNPGFGPAIWFAAEPVGVAAITIAAALVLLVLGSRVPRAVAAGVMVAYGAQTFLLFLGYVALAIRSQSAQVGPGGVVGMVAGVLIFAAGILALGSVMQRQNPAGA
jgi:hypothetical protein